MKPNHAACQLWNTLFFPVIIAILVIRRVQVYIVSDHVDVWTDRIDIALRHSDAPDIQAVVLSDQVHVYQEQIAIHISIC